MKKRFIIALDSTTISQERRFHEFLQSLDVSWWHWLSGLWLVTTTKSITATDLQQKMREVFPGVHFLVFEFSLLKETWAGYGPSSENKNMFDWLNKNW